MNKTQSNNNSITKDSNSKNNISTFDIQNEEGGCPNENLIYSNHPQKPSSSNNTDNNINQPTVEAKTEEDYNMILSNPNKFNNLIQINAESIGIKSLNNDIMDFMNLEITYKMKEILSNAKKFMRVSKRKTMKSDDINNALAQANFKKIVGFDSYASVEFERIENYKGMWKQKQSVVDIDNYLSKPIATCPMDIFPHFHWIAIEGKRPNIAENFIKEKIKVNPGSSNKNMVEADKEKNIKDSNKLVPNINIDTINLTVNNTVINNHTPINTHINHHIQPNTYYSNLPLSEKSTVIQPLIHNITKELQIFLENFELRFRKEIKQIKASSPGQSPHKMTKELEISLTALRNEPGLVELLPYLIEFFMNTFNNKQNLAEPRIQYLIVTSLKSIVINPYFNLSPYLHQIISLIMSIVLMGREKNFTYDLVMLKLEACWLMMVIYKKFEFMYPEFIKQLLSVVNKCLILREENPRLVSLFGAINFMNCLGPEFLLELVLPKMETILSSLESVLSRNEELLSEYMSNKYGYQSSTENKNSNIIQFNMTSSEISFKGKDSQACITEIDNTNNNSITHNKASRMKTLFNNQLNFSQTFNINNFSYDMFGTVSTLDCNKSKSLEEGLDAVQNKDNSGKEKSKMTGKSVEDLMKKVKSNLGGNSSIVHSVSFVYYSLKDSAKVIIDYVKNFEFDNSNEIISKLTALFGDDLLIQDLMETKNPTTGLDITI
eukprot:CAMPEP_0170524252 /NCGR_PEP_ID=MMETSP0209-20121228/9665_1 /TAXON_ID=665100 ORGANISM="Litonotus pictus, Strain P1" /NCGR_SAMPLE_ID=MMETSP0209 /ASSEMBLY_ACC=CAM_ASM_000301 /LENGTH=719 /DNA_ID=CAMNT_0010812805 /DNA_START=1 /DNA_END=2160 /DNA_ORIENTATION=-